MSLIDELRDLGKLLPPSHIPSVGEMAGVVGALIAKVEHGEQVFSDDIKTDAQKLSDLLGGTTPEPEPTPVAPVPPVSPPTSITPPEATSAPLPASPVEASGSDLASEVSSLKAANDALTQQLQTALAALNTARANNDLVENAAVNEAAAPTSTVVAS